MPIGFSSGDVAAIQLDCVDKDRPQRATFRFRFLTAGEMKQVERLRREAWDSRTLEETDAKLNEALRVGLVGWDGLKDGDADVPFTDAGLDRFSIRLKFNVVDEYPTSLLLTASEKKA